MIRRKAIALFKYDDKIGGADVIFGEKGGGILLGAMTLESLGLDLPPRRVYKHPLRSYRDHLA